jgi:signal transduction histidine kinase
MKQHFEKITDKQLKKQREAIAHELQQHSLQLLSTAKLWMQLAREKPEMCETCMAKSEDSLQLAIDKMRNLYYDLVKEPVKQNLDDIRTGTSRN